MIRKIYDLALKYDEDDVLLLAGCSKEDKNYDSYKGMLADLTKEHLPKIQAKGYAYQVEHEGKPTLFCMVTLGKHMDHATKKAFETYEYLDGVILNALGDVLLFEATNDLYGHIKKEALKLSYYLGHRIEPGGVDVPMSLQKVIYDYVVPAFNLPLGITEGFMLSPTKSVAYYYEMSKEACDSSVDHDCSSCDSIKCPIRKNLVHVHHNGVTDVCQAKKGENLLTVLRKHHIFIDAPCNGKGLCGKCKVTAQGHNYTLSESEEGFLSEEEIGNDVILACLHTVEENMTIIIGEVASNHRIEVDYMSFEVKDVKYPEGTDEVKEAPIGFAIDIGTTTVAMGLVNLASHEILGTHKVINPQKAYGSDVISRIMHVGENKDHDLGAQIKKCIGKGVTLLLRESGRHMDEVEAMILSGNTSMIYFLLDMDPTPLAVAPFKTEMMTNHIFSSKSLLGMGDFKVEVLPYVSAYVGGDIVSGLYGTHMDDEARNVLFIDIGTNGEMVLSSKGKMYCAATAAGPAFEGANIRCGMGSVEGAICEIHSDENAYEVTTFGDLDPAGICGSALIDAIALLHQQGHIDNMGFMAEPVMFYGEIGIYPEDVRQVQLAKAAIKAGVEVLMEAAGLTYDEVDALYIAGGFGRHINVANSAYIGLIPEELAEKVTVAGNTSLGGCVRYLLERNGQDEVHSILGKCTYIELSSNMKFNESYVMNMCFGEMTW